MTDTKIKIDFKNWFVTLSKVLKSKTITNESMVNGFLGNGLIA